MAFGFLVFFFEMISSWLVKPREKETTQNELIKEIDEISKSAQEIVEEFNSESEEPDG